MSIKRCITLFSGVNTLATVRAQSRKCYRKSWDCFPSSTGGKTLGFIPEVFVNELLGNVAQTPRERLPRFWNLDRLIFDLPSWQQLAAAILKCIKILRQNTFPWSSGDVPKEYVNEDHGNDSHGVREEFFLLHFMGNDPMTCDNTYVIEP